MKKKVSIIAGIAGIVLLIGLGMFLQIKLQETFDKKEITTQYITGKLEDMGELTTQQVTYSSHLTVEEGTIPFITQKGFTMQYTATMRAGIRFEEMSVKVKKNVVEVKIPHAVVQSNKVEPDSIVFTDEKKAVFNWKTEEDVTEALAAAEADLENNPTVDYVELLESADARTEELIHKLLDGSVGGRKVEVSFE